MTGWAMAGEEEEEDGGSRGANNSSSNISHKIRWDMEELVAVGGDEVAG